MSILNRSALALALLSASVSAYGDGIGGGIGQGLGGGISGFDNGISASGGTPVVLTPCGALQLDFSVATGCNAVGIILLF